MCIYITFHEVQDKIKGIASPYKNAVVRSFLVHKLSRHKANLVISVTNSFKFEDQKSSQSLAKILQNLLELETLAIIIVCGYFVPTLTNFELDIKRTYYSCGFSLLLKLISLINICVLQRFKVNWGN